MVYSVTTMTIFIGHEIVTSTPAWLHVLLAWVKRDLPNWLQAVGTIGAVFAAIWLATREDRRRVAESIALGELTAIAVNKRLIQMRVCTKHHKEVMQIVADNKDGGVVDIDIFGKAEADLTKLNIVSDQELRDLIVVPDRAAKKIAQAIAGIKLAISHCQEQSGRTFTNKTQRIAALEFIGCLIQVPEELEYAHRSVWRYMNAREPIENWMM